MNSLQEQLMKAGLASKQDARNAKAEKRKKQKQKKKKGTVEVTELEQQLQQAKLEKQEKDKALNRELQEKAERKADIAKVKQMIKQHGLQDIEGEQVFRFTYDNKVKELAVDERTRDALTNGKLGVCVLEDDFYLLADETVRRISAIDESVVAYLYELGADETASEELDEDDPYAAYQIPDDLMW